MSDNAIDVQSDCQVKEEDVIFEFGEGKFAINEQMLGGSWANFAPGHEFPPVETLLEKKEENRRLGNIDMRALAYACSSALCVDEVPTFEFLGKGSFNVALRVTFSKTSVVARLPYEGSWSPGLVSSQVATMAFAFHRLRIPTPSVFAWNDNTSIGNNPVNSPYMIMEFIEGVSLYDVWNPSTPGKKEVLVPDKNDGIFTKLWITARVAFCHSRMLLSKQRFSKHGGLYFSDSVRGADSADLTDMQTYQVGRMIRQKDPIISDVYADWPMNPFNDIRAFWLEGVDHEYAAMRTRWFNQSDSNPVASEKDDIVKRIADCDGVTRSDMEDIVEALKRMINSCPLDQARCQVLCHPDLALRNVIVHPKTHKIRAIIDWDSAAVLPFEIFPKYFQDLCSTDVDGYGIHSRDIYASLPGDDVSKGHDFSSLLNGVTPGELATSNSMSFKMFMEVEGMTWIAWELLRLRHEYPLFLRGCNENLPLETWEDCAKAKIMHYLVTRGFTSWCRSRFMLLGDAPPASHGSSGRSRDPRCEETASNSLGTLSVQKLRAEKEKEGVHPDEPSITRSLFFFSVLPLLLFGLHRALSRA